MQYDPSWRALLRPGNASGFFSIRPLPAFDIGPTTFNAENAWWLAEMSRLIYRREAEPEEPGFKPRIAILEELCIREIVFASGKNAQWALNRVEGVNPFTVLVFRGTSGFENWLANLNVFQSPWEGGGHVHSGFKAIFTEIRAEIESALEQVAGSVIFTGHSLGGALAVLAAAVWPARATYTFGAPRVGDSVFRECLAGQAIYRIANERDIVTSVPPSRIPFEFCHVGEAICLQLPEDDVLNMGITTDAVAPVDEGPLRAEASRFYSHPPRFLSDHAPINYSVGLAQYLGRDETA